MGLEIPRTHSENSPLESDEGKVQEDAGVSHCVDPAELAGLALLKCPQKVPWR